MFFFVISIFFKIKIMQNFKEELFRFLVINGLFQYEEGKFNYKRGEESWKFITDIEYQNLLLYKDNFPVEQLPTATQTAKDGIKTNGYFFPTVLAKDFTILNNVKNKEIINQEFDNWSKALYRYYEVKRTQKSYATKEELIIINENLEIMRKSARKMLLECIPVQEIDIMSDDFKQYFPNESVMRNNLQEIIVFLMKNFKSKEDALKFHKFAKEKNFELDLIREKLWCKLVLKFFAEGELEEFPIFLFKRYKERKENVQFEVIKIATKINIEKSKEFLLLAKANNNYLKIVAFVEKWLIDNKVIEEKDNFFTEEYQTLIFNQFLVYNMTVFRKKTENHKYIADNMVEIINTYLTKFKDDKYGQSIKVFIADDLKLKITTMSQENLNELINKMKEMMDFVFKVWLNKPKDLVENLYKKSSWRSLDGLKKQFVEELEKYQFTQQLNNSLNDKSEKEERRGRGKI